MPRYIDADALKELIDGGFDIDFDEVPETKNALLHMIDYQETADVVEVVRCEECEHRNGDYCHRFHDGYSAFIHRDDFCNYGERRGDD